MISEASNGDRPILIGGIEVIQLIGNTSFTEALLLSITGTRPDAGQCRMVDAVLVTIMEHGITPSTLAARVVLDGAPESPTGAMAAGLLAIGSRFLGTIGDAAALFQQVVAAEEPTRTTLRERTRAEVVQRVARGERIPGLGHNLHDSVDPRVEPLLDLARSEGKAGDSVRVAEQLPSAFADITGKSLLLNAAGAVGAILSDLGFTPTAIRGFAAVARCGGLLSHVLDEIENPIGRRVWQQANDGA